MHTYKRKIYLADTDATGVLYFPQLFKLAGEAFESFLDAQNISLQNLIKNGPYLMPVVHAEADFIKPLTVGDEVIIQMVIDKISTSSFTLKMDILHKKEQLVAQVKVTHVMISQTTWKSMPIPEEVKKILA